MDVAVTRESERVRGGRRRVEPAHGDLVAAGRHQQEPREEVHRREQPPPGTAGAAEAHGEQRHDQGADGGGARDVDAQGEVPERRVVADLERIRRTRPLAERERRDRRHRCREQRLRQAAEQQHAAREREDRTSGAVEAARREREDEPPHEEGPRDRQQHADAERERLRGGTEAVQRAGQPEGDQRVAVRAPRTGAPPGQAREDEDEHVQGEHERVSVRVRDRARGEHDRGGRCGRDDRCDRDEELRRRRPAGRKPRRVERLLSDVAVGLELARRRQGCPVHGLHLIGPGCGVFRDGRLRRHDASLAEFRCEVPVTAARAAGLDLAPGGYLAAQRAVENRRFYPTPSSCARATASTRDETPSLR